MCTTIYHRYFLFQIKYDEFNFQQYSNNVHLLKHKEDMHIYPPRFKLWCSKIKNRSDVLFNRSLSLKLKESSNITKEICSFPFTAGPGNYSCMICVCCIP